jgi:thiol:disulfide interchange protein
VAELYRVQGAPTTIFIAPDGNASRKILGPLVSENLIEAVELIIP